MQLPVSILNHKFSDIGLSIGNCDIQSMVFIVDLIS